MSEAIHILDVVALTSDLPERKLYRGQVGTVVEALADGAVEVDFSDDDGKTYAMAPIPRTQLLVLRYQPVTTA